MIRRRAGPNEEEGALLADDETGRKGSLTPRRTSSAPTPSLDKVQPIVPSYIVMLVVIVFVGAGILQESLHRGRVPFGMDEHGPEFHETDVDHSAVIKQLQQPVTVPQQSLLSKEQDEKLERDSDGRRYHVVFSTDCSPYQHWQSYLVFYTAMKVGQPGHVTRIASGCDDESAQQMQLWFQRDIQFMSSRFHLQLTPHFSQVKNEKGEVIGDYKFFNKPYGTKYWLENSPQIQRQSDGTFLEDIKDDIVILIDPDMALLRPITADFTNDAETVITPKRREHIVTRVVGPGKPAAQVYGFGSQWAKLDLVKVTGDPNTPAAKVTHEEGSLYYPVGPPYMATVTDMYNIAVNWSKFVPKVYEQYPYLLAEMFAFCIAAAHLKLPHQLINSLMVSDTGASNAEGWPLIDVLSKDQVCEFAGNNPSHEVHPLPNVVHLCQRYMLGDNWFFGKRRMPADVYQCETPLLEEPPSNVATLYNYKFPPMGKKTPLNDVMVVREAFMVCYLHYIVNEASLFYRKNSCDPSTINTEKTRNMADLIRNAGKRTK